MPVGPTKTKAQKQRVVRTEMHKFKEGTLHSGSKHGHVVDNRKQAIAIALSESHQSRKDSKHHSVRHSPGGPANNDGYIPSVAHKAGAGHTPQPKGNHSTGKLGFAEGRHHPGQSYAAEQREHWGNKAKGKQMGHSKEFGFVGKESRGSELQHTAPASHEKQSDGHTIGNGDPLGKAEHHPHMSKTPHTFSPPAMQNAHGFGHHKRDGFHRLSGSSKAHRIGRK